MTFLALNWLNLSVTLLLVFFVAVCFLMALLVLMQRPKQEGLGAAFGGGMTDQVFGARTTDVLQKGTVYLASLFFILSFALAILITKQDKNKNGSLLDDKKPVAKAVEKNPAPVVAPTTPPASLVNDLPVTPTPATETPTPTETPIPPIPQAPPTSPEN